MVKVGFICEGQTEEALFLSDSFKQLLASKNIERVNVINAFGCGNLLPFNIEQHIQALENNGAEKIFIVTDLDNDACVTVTKQRLRARPQDIVIIAVKKIEAWFLGATLTMGRVLNSPFYFEFPEKEGQPFETINQVLITHLGRGIGNKSSAKIKLVNLLLKAGLDISEAAAHPNCQSAAYFIKKLNELTA